MCSKGILSRVYPSSTFTNLAASFLHEAHEGKGAASMKQKVALTEQTAYHGYAANGRPIPKRGSQPHTQVQTSPPAASQYTQWVEDEFDTSDDSEYEPPRMPSSARRYMPEGSYMQGKTRFNVKYEPPPQRPALQVSVKPKRQQVRDDLVRERGRIHWLVFVGVGMIVMLALWVLGNTVLTWWNTCQDDIHYGRPRTFQTDAVVGHSASQQNPSHFIALNLHAHIEIIELPGGDGTHARIYMGPTLYGYNVDLVPVTLSFKDVTGKGRPDMLIHFQDQTVVFVNDGTQFRPQRPGDHIHL